MHAEVFSSARVRLERPVRLVRLVHPVLRRAIHVVA